MAFAVFETGSIELGIMALLRQLAPSRLGTACWFTPLVKRFRQLQPPVLYCQSAGEVAEKAVSIIPVPDTSDADVALFGETRIAADWRKMPGSKSNSQTRKVVEDIRPVSPIATKVFAKKKQSAGM